MQGTLFEPQNLPDLPSPGFIDQWVLEFPLPLSLVCFVTGAIVFGALRQTKYAKKIGVSAVVIGFIAGASIFLIGTLTITDIEHLKARSVTVATAASAGDQPALRPLLHQDVRVKTSFVSQSGRDRILALAASRAAPLIESVAIRETRAGLFGPLVARTQIKIKISADMIPPMSWWTLDWTRPDADSDDWVVTHIEPIWIQGITNPAGSN